MNALGGSKGVRGRAARPRQEDAALHRVEREEDLFERGLEWSPSPSGRGRSGSGWRSEPGAGQLETEFVFSPNVIALAFLFSVIIGVVFGFIPARKAARLDPIEALRHE